MDTTTSEPLQERTLGLMKFFRSTALVVLLALGCFAISAALIEDSGSELETQCASLRAEMKTLRVELDSVSNRLAELESLTASLQSESISAPVHEHAPAPVSSQDGRGEPLEKPHLAEADPGETDGALWSALGSDSLFLRHGDLPPEQQSTFPYAWTALYTFGCNGALYAFDLSDPHASVTSEQARIARQLAVDQVDLFDLGTRQAWDEARRNTENVYWQDDEDRYKSFYESIQGVGKVNFRRVYLDGRKGVVDLRPWEATPEASRLIASVRRLKSELGQDRIGTSFVVTGNPTQPPN